MVMTVSYYCKSCEKQNKIKTKATNRYELQLELGDEINNRCNFCGTIEKRHINRLSADLDYSVFFISLIVSILLTTLFWNVGFVAIFTLMLPIWAYFKALKKANLFNKTRIIKNNASSTNSL